LEGFVVAVLKLVLRLPENYLISNTNVTTTGVRKGLECNWLITVYREGFCLSGVEPDRYTAGP
jgi:hypothetical protein